MVIYHRYIYMYLLCCHLHVSLLMKSAYCKSTVYRKCLVCTTVSSVGTVVRVCVTPHLSFLQMADVGYVNRHNVVYLVPSDRTIDSGRHQGGYTHTQALLNGHQILQINIGYHLYMVCCQMNIASILTQRLLYMLYRPIAYTAYMHGITIEKSLNITSEAFHIECIHDR